MKVSDYIVEYLIEKGVSDVFGYPGGMVTHFMDSLRKHQENIHTYLAYNEQGAAFAACGYAQAGGRLGVAFATSGPGAVNLLNGVCSSYFDSIPVLFITGQVNSFESKRDLKVRQRGFQETDIVSMAKGVTKYASYVKNASEIKYKLEKAVYKALDCRKGAVLLDIPMDVFCSDIILEEQEGYSIPKEEISAINIERHADRIIKALERSKKPVLLVGQGLKNSKGIQTLKTFILKAQIPTVTSMIAVDAVAQRELHYGFIGAYGNRVANFIVAKCDLLISLGARMDIRQTGKNRADFAPNAQIIRIDNDVGEFEYKVHDDEIQILADAGNVISSLAEKNLLHQWDRWISICRFIKDKLHGIDEKEPNKAIRSMSRFIPDHTVVTTDVGQNQVWVSQSFERKKEQKFLYSGSHGAMGYSLPAAIGAAIETGEPVYSFNGDGGFQMNIQELQMLVREQIPVKIIILNNHALGMIRHFQEMYFDSNYFMTVEGEGYQNPDFGKIAQAYGIPYKKINGAEHISENPFTSEGPEMVEIFFDLDTYVYPKLEYGRPNQDQEPLLERGLYDLLMDDMKIQTLLEKQSK